MQHVNVSHMICRYEKNNKKLSDRKMHTTDWPSKTLTPSKYTFG